MSLFSKPKAQTPTEEILARMQNKTGGKYKTKTKTAQKKSGLRKWFLMACAAVGVGVYTQREPITDYLQTQTPAITEELKKSLKNTAADFFGEPRSEAKPEQMHSAPVPFGQERKQELPRLISGEIKRTPSAVAQNISHLSMFSEVAKRLDDTGVIKKDNVFINYTNVSDWYAMIGRDDKLMQSAENQRIWQAWLSQFSHLRNADLRTKLEAVDAVVDRSIKYELDFYTVGRQEYYSSPIETLKRGQGDCDDFAILKYMTLKDLGVPEASMYMLSVDWEGKGQVDHAILAVSLDGKAPTAQSEVALLNNDGEGVLISTIDRPQLVPYMAMNGQQGLFAFPALFNSLKPS